MVHTAWIKGKWSNPGKGVAPPLHVRVENIKKGAFGSPSTTVGQLLILYFDLNAILTEV